jgi:predicted component of type VI protein secretion system
MKLSLMVMTPGNKMEGKAIPITLAQFVIGRDPQCQLRPASAVISKRHCAVLVREGKVFVRDFDSTNGTFVNEEQVKGEVPVKDGDELRIGPINFVVKIETTAPVNKPTPAPPAKKLTPVPAPAAEKAATETAVATKQGGDSDDDIAAMLLSLQDDGPPSPGGLQSEVPEGSTVMDIPAPAAAGAEPAKDDKNKTPSTKPLQMGDTRSAAKNILEKYMRRPRGQ